jgi:ketosteroid isomerase-like protein
MWGLLVLLLLTGITWAQGSPEKTVTDLEHKWLESQKTNNPDLIAPYLADKFQMMEPDGSLTSKAEYLKTSKATKYSSVDYSDLKVTVFGNTAIATGVYHGKGTAAGKPLDDRDRFADTWVKMPDGKWQCVVSANVTAKM